MCISFSFCYIMIRILEYYLICNSEILGNRLNIEVVENYQIKNIGTGDVTQW